jgi:hypothetical protein
MAGAPAGVVAGTGAGLADCGAAFAGRPSGGNAVTVAGPELLEVTGEAPGRASGVGAGIPLAEPREVLRAGLRATLRGAGAGATRPDDNRSRWPG